MKRKINDCSKLFHENGKKSQNVNSKNKHCCKQSYKMYSKLSKEQLSWINTEISTCSKQFILHRRFFAMLQTTETYENLFQQCIIFTVSDIQLVKGKFLYNNKIFYSYFRDGRTNLKSLFLRSKRELAHFFFEMRKFTSPWDSLNKNLSYYALVSYSRMTWGLSIVARDCSSIM